MTNLSPLALEMIKTVARFVRRGHTYVPFPEFVKAVRSEHTDDELIDALYEALDGGFLVVTRNAMHLLAIGFISDNPLLDDEIGVASRILDFKSD